MSETTLSKDLNFSVYEFKYSLQVVEKLLTKKEELKKVINKIEEIILKSINDNGLAKEVIAEKKTNLSKLDNIILLNEDDIEWVIELGTEVVTLLNVQNRLFTNLQLHCSRKINSGTAASDLMTAAYLIDYGRNLLLDILT
ncbi:hypothetical protein JCM9140_2134 [Halalkalibacter wakoensis JCM 9140]|uniref:Uncharacterized protein n=1 Tax=Halalkalibacter wakoensis JCM 9140 TaxID=1236970 RepID=W4Q203_9BACI|nr:hypothetical protein [Halalkalibacter wakoensis]GAE26106.1 hypothetical protein JCM9140_2134 [Halalkalibacter wakoensis JCM 9140]